MVIPLRTEGRQSVLDLPPDLSEAFQPLGDFVASREIPSVDDAIYLLDMAIETAAHDHICMRIRGARSI